MLERQRNRIMHEQKGCCDGVTWRVSQKCERDQYERENKRVGATQCVRERMREWKKGNGKRIEINI
jgi:cation transport regulator ChaC